MAIFEDDGSYDVSYEYSRRPVRGTRRKYGFVEDDIAPEDLQDIYDYLDTYGGAFESAEEMGF